jgi:uncharacterized protein (DUF1330 family)
MSMPAFLIADIDVTDDDVYKDYRSANPDIVNKFGGRYVALGGMVKVLEGDWHPNRTVIIEFPDMESLEAFYTCDEYVKLREIRWRSAKSRLVAIETLAEPRERP